MSYKYCSIIDFVLKFYYFLDFITMKLYKQRLQQGESIAGCRKCKQFVGFLLLNGHL